VQPRSIFEGIRREELRRVLRRAERRSFPSGSVVLAEGDSPYEMYVVKSGAADVYVTDAVGEEHRIGYVTPGGTLGEMSMFTGSPAAGTVRATTDLDVYAIGEQEFDLLAEQFPVIYRNLGAILSERLDRSNRRALSDPTGHVTILRDWARRRCSATRSRRASRGTCEVRSSCSSSTRRRRMSSASSRTAHRGRDSGRRAASASSSARKVSHPRRTCS
jgi:CRP-like cAMP-binding protein